MGDIEFRAKARELATYGVADLARAFNHCHNPTIRYRYADDVQARFLEMAIELVKLVETGMIVPRRVSQAQADPGFQRLMGALAASSAEATK